MHSKSPGYPELVFKYQAATDKVFVSNPGHGYMQVGNIAVRCNSVKQPRNCRDACCGRAEQQWDGASATQEQELSAIVGWGRP